jgi:hypothetical protein
MLNSLVVGGTVGKNKIFSFPFTFFLCNFNCKWPDNKNTFLNAFLIIINVMIILLEEAD